jgi:hypothetical protein
MGRNFYNAPTIKDVVNGATNFAQIITVQYAQLGLTQPQATAFQTLATTLEAKYQLAERPDSRTPVAIEARNVARLAMKQSALNLARIIESTPTVTNDQLVALGLLPRRTPSPVPTPGAAPGVELISVVGSEVNIRVYNAQSATRRGKPAGAAAAFIYTFVGAEYPADPSKWTFQGSTSKTTFKAVFAGNPPAGTQVWISASWFNARQETGPSSVPITTYLQYAGVTVTGDALKIAA